MKLQTRIFTLFILALFFVPEVTLASPEGTSCVQSVRRLMLRSSFSLINQYKEFLREQSEVTEETIEAFAAHLSGDRRLAFDQLRQTDESFQKEIKSLESFRRQDINNEFLRAHPELSAELWEQYKNHAQNNRFLNFEESLSTFRPQGESQEIELMKKLFFAKTQNTDSLVSMRTYFSLHSQISTPPSTNRIAMEYLESLQEEGIGTDRINFTLWKRISSEKKNDLLGLLDDLNDKDLATLKVKVIAWETGDRALDPIYSDSLGRVVLKLKAEASNHPYYNLDQDSFRFSIKVLTNHEKTKILGFQARYSAKTTGDEIIDVENSGYSINFDHLGEMISDEGDVLPIPQ